MTERCVGAIVDLYEYNELLKDLKIKCENIKKIIRPDDIQVHLNELEHKSMAEDFWNNQEVASKLLKEKRKLQRTLDKYQIALQNIHDAIELFEIAKAEQDTDSLTLLFAESHQLHKLITEAEIEVMLNGEHDNVGHTGLEKALRQKQYHNRQDKTFSCHKFSVKDGILRPLLNGQQDKQGNSAQCHTDQSRHSGPAGVLSECRDGQHHREKYQYKHCACKVESRQRLFRPFIFADHCKAQKQSDHTAGHADPHNRTPDSKPTVPGQ